MREVCIFTGFPPERCGAKESETSTGTETGGQWGQGTGKDG